MYTNVQKEGKGKCLNQATITVGLPCEETDNAVCLWKTNPEKVTPEQMSPINWFPETQKKDPWVILQDNKAPIKELSP